MSIFSSLLHHPKTSLVAKQFVGTEPEIDRWTVSEFIVDKIVPIVGVRPYPLSELEMLVAIVLWYKPSHICDWGTHFGKATRIFYETVHTFNLKTKIISIDLPANVDHIEHPHGERGKFVKNIPSVELLLGDGVTTSLACLKKSSRKNIRPLFFLDGDHSYKSVKRELNLIGKAYPRSAIIIHDTFYQSKDSNYNVGPYLAVTEYLAKHQQYKVVYTNLGLPGMTTLLPI